MSDTANPVQTIQVPDRYKQLGAVYGFAPVAADGVRIIIESLPGRGKTQLLMSMPSQIVLDFDCAGRYALAPRSTSIPILKWDDYAAAKKLLLDDAAAGKKAYNRVGFDTVDRFLAVINGHLLEDINKAREAKKYRLLNSITEYGESGAGFARLTAALVSELRDFEQAGYPYTLACHMRVRTERIGSGDKIVEVSERRCVMPPNTMEALVGAVDIKARMERSMDTVVTSKSRTETVKDSDGKSRPVTFQDNIANMVTRYWLQCMPSTADQEHDDDTKRRVPTLEGAIEIPLIDGWAAFCGMYKQAVAAATEIEKDHKAPSAGQPTNV